MTIKKYLKIYNINPLYVTFRYANGYFEEINGNQYLTLVHTNESKENIKKYEELWIKIRDLLRSITRNLGDYGEKYMIIKLNSDDKLAPIKNDINSYHSNSC